ncbi:MAG: anti-sigma F factor [Lachnospiraceae bacterium]|nr:anti-sigma F factor [Lachnospiraceae bacterium]
MKNEVTLEFDAVSANEGFARVAVAAFITPLNPTIEEIADVKTALSEAVTNAIIHGYEEKEGKVTVRCVLEGDRLTVEVTDRGKGMENVEQAMEPLFTTRPELERSGMGFAFMEAFMDELEVESAPGEGTTVRMRKKLGTDSYLSEEE